MERSQQSVTHLLNPLQSERDAQLTAIIQSSLEAVAWLIVGEAPGQELNMNADEWGPQITQARERLLEARDFHALCNYHHNLIDGVVLTCVSDVPFEMSFKCVVCRLTFWFENTAWSTGGVDWRLASRSMEQAARACGAQDAGRHERIGSPAPGSRSAIQARPSQS